MSVEIIDWRQQRDDDGILWLYLDQQNTETNVLSVSVLEQMDALLDQIVADLPAAVIFRSAKPSGFIAGADVREFLDISLGRSHSEDVCSQRNGNFLN